MDEGEELLDAAVRELGEETGARSVTFLGRTPDWMAYDFPKSHQRRHWREGWIGQKQIWFAFRFDGPDSEFDIGAHQPPEFDLWRWATPKEAVAAVAPFKLATYRKMLKILCPLIEQAAS